MSDEKDKNDSPNEPAASPTEDLSSEEAQLKAFQDALAEEEKAKAVQPAATEDISSEEAQLKAFQDALAEEEKAKAVQPAATEEQHLQEWMNALKDEKPNSTLNMTDLLNQSDIDKLFDNGGKSAKNTAGKNVLLGVEGAKTERFPMLEIVFDRFVQSTAMSMRGFLQASVETKSLSIRSLTFSDYLNSITLPAMFNIFKIDDWESTGLIMLNNSLIYSLINILLGGRKHQKVHREKIEGRAFSMLEFSLVERFIKFTLEDLSNAFSFVYPLRFSLERQETIPKLISSISNNSSVIICSIKVDMGEFSGHMDLVIPYISLDPIRDKLVKKHVGESFGQPNVWRPFLLQELMHTDIKMSAILTEDEKLLSEILQWQPGTTLHVDMHKLDEVMIRCDDISIMKGKLGHNNSMVAIEVDDVLLNNTHSAAAT